MLKILIRSVDAHFGKKGQEYLRKLYMAIFSTSYYGLFRIGEVTAGDHPITVKNVFIGTNKDKLMFILKSLKNTHSSRQTANCKNSERKCTD